MLMRVVLAKQGSAHQEFVLLRSVGREVVCDCSAEVAAVVGVLDEADVVVDDHVDGGLRADGVHVDLGVLDVDHVLLAVLLGGAELLVVVEEAVHAGRVDEHVARVPDAHAPGVLAGDGGVGLLADGEGGVVVVGVELEGFRGERDGLHVGGLGLHEAAEEGTGVLELVVVEDGVLGGSTPEPGRAGRLNEDTTAAVDGDLPRRVGVEIVVCNPEPGVLAVDTLGAASCVEHEEDTLALLLGVVALGGWAVSRFELGAEGASNADVRIPHAGLALLGSQVPLDHDSATIGTLSLEDNVADLDSALIAGLTDLEHRSGRVGIAEAGSHKQRPDLTDDLDDLGDFDGLADDVSTVVEVCDLAWLDAVEEPLNTVCVVGFTVTLATERLGRFELSCRDILILRLGAAEDLSLPSSRDCCLFGLLMEPAERWTLSGEEPS